MMQNYGRVLYASLHAILGTESCMSSFPICDSPSTTSSIKCTEQGRFDGRLAGHINNQYNTCFWKLVGSGMSTAEAQNTLKVSTLSEEVPETSMYYVQSFCIHLGMSLI
jgi:hypothetical protein